MMAAGNMLCVEAVAYGSGDAACHCISAWVPAVLKREHQQMFWLTIKDDVAQQGGL